MNVFMNIPLILDKFEEKMENFPRVLVRKRYLVMFQNSEKYMALRGVHCKRFVICMVEIYLAGEKNYTTARQDKFHLCHQQT